MPAKRLPWIKFWPELLEHRKFGDLTDAESWTWVVVWGKASQQPDRWKFGSIEHAMRATGRPRRQIQRLIDVHLVDSDAGGRLHIHDVKQWQERFPSDDSPDDPPNTPSNNGEHSVNGASITPSTLREDSANVSRDEEGRRETGEERREKKDLEEPPKAATQPKVPLVAFTESEQGIVDAVGVALAQFGFSLEPRMWRKVLDTYSAVDLEAEAYKQADWLRRNRVKSCSAARYTNWLGKAGANVTPIRRGATTDAALREHMAQEFGYLATKGSA